jgi:hypothetical protein
MLRVATSVQWTSVISLMDQTPVTWLHAVGQKLDLIRSAGRNWDRERGEPINPEIVHMACELLVPLSPLGLPVPRIAPVLGGGIQFEWDIQGRELEIEILPDQTVEYLIADKSGGVNEGPLSGVPIDQVRALAQWLLGG